tara:strand:- start:242 stop:511 length:270 start_codon:yes stop_codon:yes gene_type:complete
MTIILSPMEEQAACLVSGLVPWDQFIDGAGRLWQLAVGSIGAAQPKGPPATGRLDAQQLALFPRVEIRIDYQVSAVAGGRARKSGALQH